MDTALAPRLRELKTEYDSLQNYFKIATSWLPEVGAELEEFASEGNPNSSYISRLDQGTRDLIDLLREADFRKDTLDVLQRNILEGNQEEDLAESYRASLDTYRAGYAQKTARQKYAQHAAYFDFRSRIWEVHSEGAMPPLTDMIAAEQGDENHDNHDDDEEIVVGGTMRQFRCPLTTTLLEDPVESTVCPHAYSRAAITEYIQQAGRRGAECPAAACHAVLTLRNLSDAPGLARRVERYARQVARREELRRGAQWAGAPVLD
ncbi:hypothetical protein MYAM1_001221 [Malassezia yamatoensis]|uniref:SP-RING-type domain-containing protein n=1 Tax=Malassezia yamatoensis TaxID=253288 RepID=A0AAJ5YQ27_9BASI|nr:hypothetical protein MYAM1_001221 [Malassezia yamatoensis]